MPTHAGHECRIRESKEIRGCSCEDPWSLSLYFEAVLDTAEGRINHGGDHFSPNFSRGCLDGATISGGMSMIANFRNALGSSEVT